MRVIENENIQTRNPYTALANREDVNMDALIKKYTEDIEKLPDDTRTVEEIQNDENMQMTQAFMEFFDVDEDMNTGNPEETMLRISQMMMEEAKDVFEKAEVHRDLNIEEDAAEGIEQFTEETLNVVNDDPLLAREFKEKSERIIQKIQFSSGQESKGKQSSYYDDVKTSTTREEYKRETYTPNYQTSSTSSASSTNTQTIHNPEERRRQDAAFFGQTANNIRNLIVSGPKDYGRKDEKTIHSFTGKRNKRSFKGMMQATKSFMKSKKMKTFCKVGMMICLEASLAVIAGKYQFEGAGQMLLYIGMMMGVFHVGSMLNSEGYDIRRMSLI